jgi:hypothetical protein
MRLVQNKWAHFKTAPYLTFSQLSIPFAETGAKMGLFRQSYSSIFAHLMAQTPARPVLLIAGVSFAQLFACS